MTRILTSKSFPLIAAVLAVATAAAAMAATGDATPPALAATAGLGLFAALLSLRNWWIAEEERPLLTEELLGLHEGVDSLRGELSDLRATIGDIADMAERASSPREQDDDLNTVTLVAMTERLNGLEAQVLDAVRPEVIDDLFEKVSTLEARDRPEGAPLVDGDAQALREQLALQEERLRRLVQAVTASVAATRSAERRLDSLSQAVGVASGLTAAQAAVAEAAAAEAAAPERATSPAAHAADAPDEDVLQSLHAPASEPSSAEKQTEEQTEERTEERTEEPSDDAADGAAADADGAVAEADDAEAADADRLTADFDLNANQPTAETEAHADAALLVDADALAEDAVEDVIADAALLEEPTSDFSAVAATARADDAAPEALEDLGSEAALEAAFAEAVADVGRADDVAETASAELEILEREAAESAGLEDVVPTPAPRREPRGGEFDPDRSDRSYELLLQPIFELPGKSPRFFEATSRLRGADGALRGRADHIEDAKSAGLIDYVDNILLVRSVAIVEQLQSAGRDVAVFVNLSVQTLRGPQFLSAFLSFLEERPALSESMVFEFSQIEIGQVDDDVLTSLQRLRTKGFALSLDHVTDWSVDIERLSKVGFRYLKLDAGDFLDRIRAAGGSAERLLQAFDAIDMQLIVEKIETDAELQEIVASGARLAQGNVLAEPRLIQSPRETVAARVNA